MNIHHKVSRLDESRQTDPRSVGIIRLAGLPFQTWSSAGNPSLFETVDAYIEASENRAAIGKILADNIGNDLIPNEIVTKEERSKLLRLRRNLFNNRRIYREELDEAVELAERVLGSSEDLVGRLAAMASCVEQLEMSENLLQRHTSDEQIRVAQLAWNLVNSFDEVKNLVYFRNAALIREVESCIAKGMDWSSKDLQKRAKVIWKIIERASTKSTPRDWHGQLAIVESVESDQSSKELTLQNMDVACLWTENLHAKAIDAKEEFIQQAKNDPKKLLANRSIRLSLTPLNKVERDLFSAWTVSPINPTKAQEVQLQRTDYFEAIRVLLTSGGGLSIDELATAVAGDDEEEREIVIGFIAHLVSLDVIQLSQILQRESYAWKPINKYVSESVVTPQAQGYLDVMRPPLSILSSSVEKLDSNCDAALRLFKLLPPARPSKYEQSITVDGAGVPLMKLVEEAFSATIIKDEHYLTEDEGTSQSVPIDTNAWPIPIADISSPNQAYVELHRFIGESDERVISIDDELIDRLELINPPSNASHWPIDFMIRIAAGSSEHIGVLEDVFSAGTIDARFADVIEAFHGSYTQADEYRKFVNLVEKESGVRMVEVLMPPNALGAANAVRRSIPTDSWTGDSNIEFYGSNVRSRDKFIPIEQISVHRYLDEWITKADGEIIFPMYNASRVPMPPWDRVIGMLTRSGPENLRWNSFQLHNSLSAFPEKEFVPRIAVNNSLIITPAQWRVQIEDLPNGKSSKQDLRCLALLRKRVGTRFVYASADGSRKPRACDLDSVRSIETLVSLRKLCSHWVMIAEMIPNADHLAARQADGSRIMSCLVRRVYNEGSFAQSAEAVGRSLREWMNKTIATVDTVATHH